MHTKDVAIVAGEACGCTKAISSSSKMGVWVTNKFQ